MTSLRLPLRPRLSHALLLTCLLSCAKPADPKDDDKMGNVDDGDGDGDTSGDGDGDGDGDTTGDGDGDGDTTGDGDFWGDGDTGDGDGDVVGDGDGDTGDGDGDTGGDMCMNRPCTDYVKDCKISCFHLSCDNGFCK